MELLKCQVIYVTQQVKVSIFLCFSDFRPLTLNIGGIFTRNLISKSTQLKLLKMESQAKYMFQEHSIKFLYTHKFGSAEMSNVAS